MESRLTKVFMAIMNELLQDGEWVADHGTTPLKGVVCGGALCTDGRSVRRGPRRPTTGWPARGSGRVRPWSDAGGQRASEAARTDVVADQLLQHGAPPCLVRVGADIVAQTVAARPLINAPLASSSGKAVLE